MFNSEKRPKLKISLSWKEKILILISTLCVIAMWVYLYISWSNLPSIIPIHFGITGAPDRFGNKTSVFLLPIIASIMHILLVVLSKIPHCFNYPVSVTEKSAEVLYKIGKELILLLDMELSLMFLIILREDIRLAIGNTGGLGIGIILISMAVILGTVVYETIRMNRFKG
jgi:uncharacterized membrane protein